jgi:tRNA A-37 threonylcarbamoyl transferase component Bud32
MASEHPSPELTGAHTPADEAGGTVVAGRYKLLEKIGEGAMGEVWIAQQVQPVRRKVALKLVKPGMDSRTVLSRFEAERQALALMDHPNIAKILDGGRTDQGRPFFVMEYVKGVPITHYCDDAHLSVQERLTLLIPICRAVQHAHQKGIIHRDLKPSNILICLNDGKPVPMVIDFGLAKAMHQPLTEDTVHTAHGVMVGTPLYMSPEQAELNNLDIDTRSDIYSLGVILYELLTGTTPLERHRFREAAWHEILRIIKEEEPPKPSARLSSTVTPANIAARRKLEPEKLSRLVRGELDWIAMKCLEKERSRRYETANGLARDIERYLHDEPVEACPPTVAYRINKLLRRHKGPVLATALVLVSLIGGTVAATIALLRAREAEARALTDRAAAVRAEEEQAKARALADERLQATSQTLRGITKQLLDGTSIYEATPGFRLTLALIVRDALEALHKNQPPTRESERLLLHSYLNLCDAYVDLGDAPRARAAWGVFNQLARKRAGAYPNETEPREELKLNYDRLGNVEMAAGNYPGACQANLTLLEFIQKDHTVDPTHLGNRLALSDVYRNLATIEICARDHEAAVPWLQRARTILKAVEAENKLPKNSLHYKRLEWLERQITLCNETTPRVIEKLDVAFQQPPIMVPIALGFRAHALARRRRHVEAAATADQIRKLDLIGSEDPLEAVTAYSACVRAAGEDREAADQYGATAVSALRDLAAKGYFKESRRVEFLKSASALAPLSERGDFREFVAGLGSHP